MIPDLNIYSQRVLRMYLQLPDTPPRPRPMDRQLAARLHARRVDIDIIESAFLLATARRLRRSPHQQPLPPIRSMAYFLPLIDEILQQPLPPGYLDYLRFKVSPNPDWNR